MASRSLGTLTLDLIAKIGGFTSGMDQASRIADKRMREIEKRANAFGRSIGQSIKSAGAQFLAFAGVTVSVGAAISAMKGAIDLADETRDLSIRLGESTETISEFRYAAQQTGTDMDALGKGMKILAKNAADALNPMSSQAKVFDSLGIKVTDSSGKLKDLGELIPEIADKFKSLEDGTTKAALAQALFGKSGLDLTEFLNQGADGLQTMADKARALGIIIDQETADAADKFNDDLADMKAAVGGIALQVAQHLLPVMDELAVSFTETAKNGQDVSETAERISAGLKVAGYVAGQIGTAFSQLGEFLGAVAAAGKGVYEVFASIATVDFGRLTSAAALITEASHGARDALLNRQAPKSAQHAAQKITIITADSGQIPDSAFRNPAPHNTDLEKRLAGALSNTPAPHSGSGRKSSGGKSDAEREADQLKEAYDRLVASQNEQIALFGKTGEAAQVRYDTEFGELKNLSQAQKDQAIANAERLDQMKEEDEFTKQRAEDDKRKAEAAADVLQSIRQETDALGMNNDQLEIANNLWRASADANDAAGQSIVKATEALQEQRQATADQIDMMDGLRDSAHLFLDDLKEGKGIWDSLKDAAGNFADILYEMAERKLIEQIFGAPGTTGAGTSGGGWLDAIMGLFGGSSGFGGEGSPLAGGGWTDPNKFHQVGEYNRPETLMRNGKLYLIPGDRGRVEPMSGGAGGVLNQTINYITRERVDNRSRKQLAQAAGMSASEAIRSNRA